MRRFSSFTFDSILSSYTILPHIFLISRLDESKGSLAVFLLKIFAKVSIYSLDDIY